MKIALIGATGAVGSRILAEALRRGHTVTAIARHPDKLAPQPGVTVQAADVADGQKLADLLKGHDSIISAYNGVRGSPDYRETVLGTYQTILNAAKKAGVRRVLIVGGAGSLEVSPGVRLVDTPQFPREYRTEALTYAELLSQVYQDKELDWTFVSPSAILIPGERTGKFRVGEDHLIVNAQGESKISLEDLAVAILNEAEHPRYTWRRFTVGY